MDPRGRHRPRGFLPRRQPLCGADGAADLQGAHRRPARRAGHPPERHHGRPGADAPRGRVGGGRGRRRRPRRAAAPVPPRGRRLSVGAARRRPRRGRRAAARVRRARAGRGGGRRGARADAPGHHLHHARLLRRAHPPLPGARAPPGRPPARGGRGDRRDRPPPARRGARHGPARRDRGREDDRGAPPGRGRPRGGMKVGLTGFPGAGKTSVFNALTGLHAAPAGPGLNLGVIKVPDERVDALAAIYQPRKTTYAEVSFVDFPPARSAPERRTVLDAATVAQLRDADALVEVVRGFPDLAGAPPTPAADLESFAAELVLADLAVIEKRLERLKKEKGHERERALLERLAPSLEAGTPLRTLGLAAEERALLAGFAFLSLRPLLVVLNVPEAAAAVPLPGEVAARARAEGAEAMALSARLEAEIAELEPADRDAFLADLGLAESARARFIRASYALLDLISFLTIGEDECRAWPIRRGTTALKAAGKVHSDIERGFIRAEVIAYDEFMRLGSEARCREAGKLRLEGKDYSVPDGDIVHFPLPR